MGGSSNGNGGFAGGFSGQPNDLRRAPNVWMGSVPGPGAKAPWDVQRAALEGPQGGATGGVSGALTGRPVPQQGPMSRPAVPHGPQGGGNQKQPHDTGRGGTPQHQMGQQTGVIQRPVQMGQQLQSFDLSGMPGNMRGF